jgi:hypothetical protein
VGINLELYSRHACTFGQRAYRRFDMVVSQHSYMAVVRSRREEAVEDESQRESCAGGSVQKQKPDLPIKSRKRQNLINTRAIVKRLNEICRRQQMKVDGKRAKDKCPKTELNRRPRHY